MKKPLSEDVTEFNLDLNEPKEKKPAEKTTAKTASTVVPAGGQEADFFEEGVRLSDDVPVKLVCVLGNKKISLKDLLQFKAGKVINLDRAPNEIVDLTANGKLVARGELVDIDGKLGVRIIKLLK